MQFLRAISMVTLAQLVEWVVCLQTFGDALGELDQMRGSFHFMARKVYHSYYVFFCNVLHMQWLQSRTAFRN